MAYSASNNADAAYECDALVVGSGAAGMSAAVTAAHCGLNVLMGGNYPGAGITLGPALTFGYIAGRHIAGQNLPT